MTVEIIIERGDIEIAVYAEFSVWSEKVSDYKPEVAFCEFVGATDIDGEDVELTGWEIQKAEESLFENPA